MSSGVGPVAIKDSGYNEDREAGDQQGPGHTTLPEESRWTHGVS